MMRPLPHYIQKIPLMYGRIIMRPHTILQILIMYGRMIMRPHTILHSPILPLAINQTD